jgi:site-specific DNA-methyltransferase (adenine-specific)
LGRFPANIILDEYTAEVFDEQTGNRKGGTSNGDATVNVAGNGVTPLRRGTLVGRNDDGGGSRMFPIMKYNTKVSQSERKLPNGERNPHVTLKPVELIKWLIKLLTPIDGTTIDITAGSCTHGVAAEELNKNDGYNLKWIDIELMNTEDEPYCKVGEERVKNVGM